MNKGQKKFRFALNLQTFSGGAEGQARLTEIEARKGEIRALLEGDGEVNIDELEAELRSLGEEAIEIRESMVREKRKSLAAGIQAGTVEARQTNMFTPGDTPDPAKEVRKAAEKRGKELKEMRAVTVGSSNVVLPKHTASDIRGTFNEVSSLIDRVTHKPLPGGESFEQPYLKGYGTGDYTGEGANYADAEPVFGKVQISKAKVTAYAEDSEEILKLPAADYDGEVMKGITIATRKKITREILVGDGTTNHLTGIFSTAATAIDAGTDLEVSEVDEFTLDEILFNFGGDEDVEDPSVLILSKKTLKAFATLRNTDSKRVYDVKTNGNTGTIDGVPYIINSACKDVDTATVGQYMMAYGPLSNYMLTIFSDIDVQRSTDYKFKAGMIAHKSSVFVGGNVVSKNGFLRVKKAAAV
ncbi:phage major capsid protein [Paenibacillus methanolicus]|uniref:HK97 family phage major capsid protein n=1 Tax=Paenibacillus methanolicus TaxID=582686 RepID=A0A5S5BNA7_9BACL|nr:phage major capsid protein [Paenibacillus methanolicus]TYP67690.1 HK97 family phage major capsid protein [Paenibacillus methanolicus]